MGRAHEVRAASMAKTAAMKSKLYAKYGKEIFMAAKSGIPDPNTNLSLRKIIEKAKNVLPAAGNPILLLAIASVVLGSAVSLRRRK